MIIKLTLQQFEFINKSLSVDSPDLYKRFEDCIVDETYVDLDEDTISDLRDWVGFKLQIVGFDKDYEPTDQGMLMEDLIDKLFL